MPSARDDAQIQFEQDDEQRDVQRRRLVVRLVETRQEIEEPAEDPVDLAPLQRATQREEQEAADGDQLRRQEAAGMRIELPARPAERQRQTVEQVDQPVGNDRPWQQRNPLFPVEPDEADVAALAADPGGEAVAGEEEGSEQQ